MDVHGFQALRTELIERLNDLRNEPKCDCIVSVERTIELLKSIDVGRSEDAKSILERIDRLFSDCLPWETQLTRPYDRLKKYVQAIA